MAGGDELERVLGEQAAYYQALGEPADLEERLRRTGWDITITATSGPFYWRAGRRG